MVLLVLRSPVHNRVTLSIVPFIVKCPIGVPGLLAQSRVGVVPSLQLGLSLWLVLTVVLHARPWMILKGVAALLAPLTAWCLRGAIGVFARTCAAVVWPLMSEQWRPLPVMVALLARLSWRRRRVTPSIALSIAWYLTGGRGVPAPVLVLVASNRPPVLSRLLLLMRVSLVPP